MANFRRIVVEKDISNFNRAINNQVGAFVVKSRKGPAYPVLMQTSDDYLTWFGEPNVDFWHGYEVMNYITQAPAWVVRAVGSGALYAGADVRTSDVRSFGSDTGRDISSFDLSSTLTQLSYSPTGVSGDGITSVFTGFDLPIPAGSTFEPATPGHFKIKVGNTYLTINSVDSAPPNDRIIHSNALATSSTVDNVTGAINLEFNGSPGNAASYLGSVTFTSISLAGSKNKAFNLNIDGVLIPNIDLGASGTTTIAQVITTINTAINNAGFTGTLATNVGDAIKIHGVVADTVRGKVVLSPPSDFVTYDNAISLVFDNTYIGGSLTQTTAAASPAVDSFIPRNGQTLTFEYNVQENVSSDVSHTFFAASPYEDTDFSYSILVKYVSDRIYTLQLYQEIKTGGNSLINTYVYSLDKVTNSQGKSIYIFDVFKNDPYLIPIVNPNYVGIATLQNWNTIVPLNGGVRGSVPTATNIFNAWQFFKKIRRYKIKTFFDLDGSSAQYIKNLILSYQPYAFGVTTVPLGYSVDDAVAYREALNIDFANMALYDNWKIISDIYNGGGQIYTSGIGAIGVKYAEMNDVFDAESPAGVDTNGLGGQLTKGFAILDLEKEYTDFDLQTYYESQINPVVKDGQFGVKIAGDNTLQVASSDTSFVGTRRLYNFILDEIVTNILPLQEFRLNDPQRRDLMKTLCEDVINPILIAGYLRDAKVVCDETNNTDAVLNRREFVVDIYVQVTPNSQFIRLNFIRIRQDVSIADVLPA